MSALVMSALVTSALVTSALTRTLRSLGTEASLGEEFVPLRRRDSGHRERAVARLFGSKQNWDAAARARTTPPCRTGQGAWLRPPEGNFMDRSMRRILAAGTAVAAAAVAVIAAPWAAGAATQAPQIVGGNTSTQVYPWMASVEDSSGRLHCGGTLIAPNLVITAGHCVSDTTPAQVRLGTLTHASGGDVIKVKTAIANSSFEKGGDPGWDIGLLILASNATETPIKIAAGAQVGEAVRIIGWGTTSDGGQLSATLKELDTKVDAASSCGSKINSEREWCVDNPNSQGACNGDSGGPAVVQVAGEWQLIGATSRAGGGGACGERPIIYTNIPYFVSWITATDGGITIS
jgi:secreted trypsin-like serine protease